jgi:LmbE family N-acetylglucosaminyl deacetylase
MPTAFAIAAHPDDIEFLMAGTLIRLRDAGYEIHYMNVASGSCGTTQYDRNTIAAMRREEAQNACRTIGAKFHTHLVGDLEIFYEQKSLAKLAAVVREVAPRIVLTHAPVDYMEDHTNTCRLAVTAAFARGMPNFMTEPPRPIAPGPVTVYHAQPYGNRDPFRRAVRPEIFVDVTAMHEQKTKMLAEHKTQKQWLDESQGLDSYLHAMRELDAQVGTMSGRYQLAEGWRRHLHLGFCGVNDDPLVEALGEFAFVDPRYAAELG